MKAQFHDLFSKYIAKAHNLFKDQQSEETFMKHFESQVRNAANTQTEASINSANLIEQIQPLASKSEVPH